jgi:hypothetical protein
MADSPLDKFNKLIERFAEEVKPLGVEVHSSAVIYRPDDQRDVLGDKNSIQITMTVGEKALMSLDEKEQADFDDAFAGLTAGLDDLDEGLQEKVEKARDVDLLKGMMDNPDWDS